MWRVAGYAIANPPYGLSGAPLRLLPLAPRLLQAHLRQVALQLIEIMRERNAVVELEAGHRLVVELKDPLAQFGPERKALAGELDHAGALVAGVGDPFDQPVALETLQHAVQILPADDEKIGEGADRHAVSRP